MFSFAANSELSLGGVCRAAISTVAEAKASGDGTFRASADFHTPRACSRRQTRSQRNRVHQPGKLLLPQAKESTPAFELINSQSLQNRFDAGNFMRAEQIGFAQRGQHSEKRLGATDFVAEKFERMRQGVADGKSQLPQPERV